MSLKGSVGRSRGPGGTPPGHLEEGAGALNRLRVPHTSTASTACHAVTRVVRGKMDSETERDRKRGWA